MSHSNWENFKWIAQGINAVVMINVLLALCQFDQKFLNGFR